MRKPAFSRLVISIISPILFLFIFSTSIFAIGRPIFANKESVTPPGRQTACIAHESELKMRLTRLTRLASNIEEKFTMIAQRVETFYTSKIVPEGKTLANYDALTADIQAKESAVTASLSQAQTDANAFSCTSADPKGQLTLFRQDMQNVKAALKAYRTSIKNLIVAIHSLSGSESASITPNPTQ